LDLKIKVPGTSIPYAEDFTIILTASPPFDEKVTSTGRQVSWLPDHPPLAFPPIMWQWLLRFVPVYSGGTASFGVAPLTSLFSRNGHLPAFMQLSLSILAKPWVKSN